MPRFLAALLLAGAAVCFRGLSWNFSTAEAAHPSQPESRKGGARKRLRLRAQQRKPKVTHPRVITKQITSSRSAAEVLEAVRSEQANPRLDFIALSAAWARIAKLPKAPEMLADPFLPELIQLTRQWVRRSKVSGKAQHNARAVAQTFWAVAKLDRYLSPHLTDLRKSLATAAKHTARHTDAQGVANMIWATAKLADRNRNSDAELGALAALARRVEEVSEEMSPQGVENVIWATAKLAEQGDTTLMDLLPTLAAQVQERRWDLDAQAVASVVWSTAKLADEGDGCLAPLLPMLAVRCKALKGELTAQGAANVAWAAAKLLDYEDDSLLAALPDLAGRVREVRNEMTGQGIANLMWAAAKVAEHGEESLLSALPALALRVEAMKATYSAQEANILWAISKLSEFGDDSLRGLVPVLVGEGQTSRDALHASLAAERNDGAPVRRDRGNCEFTSVGVMFEGFESMSRAAGALESPADMPEVSQLGMVDAEVGVASLE
ncbi:unnamed protein product [Effrenium voratum]|nr:unnamed protein product [Effrenium voratum]